MAAAVPVAIGARGTIGSLVRKEIEYFTKHESDRSGSARKAQPQVQMLDTGSSCSSSSTGSKRSSGFWSWKTRWPRRKKRRRSSGDLVLSFRSATEVKDKDQQLDGIPGFSYSILE